MANRHDLCREKELTLNHVSQVDCDPTDNHVSDDDQGSFWFKIDIVGIFLSLASLSFISYAILSDKRVRGHPNNIIAYICLCDAFTYCQYLTRYIICGYGLNDMLEVLFSYTAMIPYWTISVKWLGRYHEDACGGEITWGYLT